MSEKEAEYLLNILKKLLADTIDIPSRGNKKTYNMESIVDRNKFLFTIRKGERNPNKCTFHVMLSDTKQGLLRLDVVDNEDAHRNPNGDILYGTHLHVYKDGLELGYAINFDLANANLIVYCKDFLRRLNVIEYDTKFYRESVELFS